MTMKCTHEFTCNGCCYGVTAVNDRRLPEGWTQVQISIDRGTQAERPHPLMGDLETTGRDNSILHLCLGCTRRADSAEDGASHYEVAVGRAMAYLVETCMAVQEKGE